jgi:hypothetical protein
MYKTFLALTAGILGLVLAGTAEARPVHGRHHERHAYKHVHPARFKGGYYYGAHAHPDWSRRVWDARYNRWNYWDPTLQVYFYWYAPGNCYYPVTYCP